MTADQNGWQDCSESERETLDAWEQAHPEPGNVRYEWRLAFWHQGIGWLQHCVHDSEAASLNSLDMLRRFWHPMELGAARLEKMRILTVEITVSRVEVS